jgi:enoyl-[acyl-carrier protein] reductase I
MLKIDLTGKKAFIAGVGDDQGYGWAIAQALSEAGAEIIIGTWPPILTIFKKSLEAGKFGPLNISKIYPLDAAFDTPDDVPSEIKENKRYKDKAGYTISEVAKAIKNDFGSIDIVVHSLANAPEIKNDLLETSRSGYLNAIGTSAYSFISLLHHLGPIINPEGAALCLSYLAAERTVPGYGGGMSSAKAALESDTRTLAWEAGRKWNIRVNAISAGPLGSRAARAIGFIEDMIEYSEQHAPIAEPLTAQEVANTAAFLLSPLSSAITGSIIYADHGLNTML